MTDTTSRSAQIAHVLFIDIVGYSRESISAQSALIGGLNEIVSASEAFAKAKANGAVHPIPTGDGMALLFFDDVIAPAQCAAEVARVIAQGQIPTTDHRPRKISSLAVRMGLHSGLLQKQIDIAGHENWVGEGINTAQRVMDFGDAGHILLSSQYANWLIQVDDWAPCVYPLGAGSAKHGQKVLVFSLHGADFGRRVAPAKLATAKEGTLAVSRSGMTPQKIALLYKPNLQPDEGILRTLEEQLRAHGHEVFVDNQHRISAAWAKAIEEPIRRSDAVIAIVSPRALQSEMLEFEIETAADQQARTGKPILLPVRIGQEEPLQSVISATIRPLNHFVWQSPEDDQRLVAELLSAIQEPLKPRVDDVKLEPVGGAVPPESPFYVLRTADQECRKALDAGESIILIKGARQMGKTSLLAQGVRRVRELGWRTGLTDFQKLNQTQMADEDVFYRLLAATLARQLKFNYDFQNDWMDIFGSNLNMENFLRELLDASEERLVWFMDEVDKLFMAPFASDFFGLVRSWHNSRSTEPDGPWNKLTVVICYATEAHLFIQDLNQSPFNVGRRLDMADFNIQQMVDLNVRYGGPLRSYEEIERVQGLIAGQPFLTRRALDVLATGKFDLTGLEAHAAGDDGPFGDHLKRLLVSVSRLPNVIAYVTAMLEGQPPANQDAYYRLLAAGIIKGSGSAPEFRCQLYASYLRRHLVKS